MNERIIRIVHGIIFVLICIISIVALGISADLVRYYDKNGQPRFHSGAYRDRIRICLAASIWTTLIGLILVIGFQLKGHSLTFGILPHLIMVALGFILFIIGAGSLTGLVSKVSCGDPYETFNRCKEVKALAVVGWIDVVLLFIALIFVLVIAFKARAWGGVHRNTLYVD